MTETLSPAPGIERLDALPQEAAQRELIGCCGSSSWAQRMAQARPFRTLERLLDAGEAIWRSLAESDWREAFDAHPRIGDRTAAGRSAEEQATALSGSDEDARLLSEANCQYEARFGRIFIVCAAGRTAPQILSLCRERLRNDESTELHIAAREQGRITRLRLEKLAGGK